jgi:hypothetical protein
VNRPLGITPAGETYRRSLLVGGTHPIVRQGRPDTDLKRPGRRVREHGGKHGKKRAVVAVARKLAVVLHRPWVSGAAYVPVGDGQVHAQLA